MAASRCSPILFPVESFVTISAPQKCLQLSIPNLGQNLSLP